jgi:fructokinase
MRSPILSQQLDTGSGKHEFSFICPDTHEELPRYRPVSEDEISWALPVLTSCKVFYADRVSAGIVGAMRTAKDAGAIVFFEPSDIEEGNLFEEALSLSTIVKYSEERLGERLGNLQTECIRIVTYGAAGLEVQDRRGTYWCRAIEAPRVLDTCGSGDMVSVGVIDWVLTSGSITGRLGATELLEGVVAGQRLAAQNCAYSGARGLFKSRGAAYARAILRGRFCSIGTE